jgi:uridine kinase
VEGSRKAFLNEYDFDSPDAIDFDVLVDRLRDLKAGYSLTFCVGSAALEIYFPFFNRLKV